jgi:UDPglucose 6-dehydrogenase
MNDHQKRRFASHIVRTLYNTVSGKRIAFLGWAFKKDTNDTRESAAINVAEYLINEQANITVFDPKVRRKQILVDLNSLGVLDSADVDGVETFDNPYEACKNAHAIAVLTEWDEFKSYDWQRIYDNMQKPAFVFDGRNILDPQEMKAIGFNFTAVGSSH